MSARARRASRALEDLSRDAQADIRAAMVPKPRRFQFVLSLRSWGFSLLGPWPSDRFVIFRWVCHVGPLEIRRVAS